MSDDDPLGTPAPKSIYENITRAHVTGKVPSAGGKRATSHGGKHARGKISRHGKSHARKLKKRGAISDSVAARLGL